MGITRLSIGLYLVEGGKKKGRALRKRVTLKSAAALLGQYQCKGIKRLDSSKFKETDNEIL